MRRTSKRFSLTKASREKGEQTEHTLERNQPITNRIDTSQLEKGSNFFLWGVGYLYPALGQRIIYEEVGRTTGDANYDTKWYASRREHLPLVPIAQGGFGQIFRCKLQESMDEELSAIRGARPDIISMNYKLALVELTIKTSTPREHAEGLDEAPYYICPAVLVGIRVPAPHEVGARDDAKEADLRDMADNIRGRLVQKLLAVQPVCIYRTLLIDLSEWHDITAGSKRVRGLNVLQEPLFSTGRTETTNAGLDSSQVRIVDLIEWKTESWALRLAQLKQLFHRAQRKLSPPK